MDGVAPPLSRRARIARTIVVGFAGLGLCAAAVALGQGDRETGKPVAEPLRSPTPSQLELRRCQALEEAALTDARCRRVWAEQRRRFLGLDEPATIAAGSPTPIALGEMR